MDTMLEEMKTLRPLWQGFTFLKNGFGSGFFVKTAFFEAAKAIWQTSL